MHPDKVFIKKLRQGVDFVGYVILPNAVVLRTRTKNRIFKKLRKAEKDLLGNKINKDEFYQRKTSYFGILKHCKNKKIKRDLKKFLSF